MIRVAIIDDHAIVRAGLRQYFSEQVDLTVVAEAANGREALDTLNASPDRICIILLDLFMPVMDGWQVIDQLRADGRLGSPHIVIITSAPYRAPAGLPVFPKPLDVDKVISTVQRLC